MDTSPSHPSPPTPVVGNMHKKAQQAAGDPTSLGAASEEGAHPQLSSGSNLSVLVDKTKSARDGLKTNHTTSGANKESRADDITRKVKLKDLSDILKDMRSDFFTPDSITDEPIIVSDESEEEENVAELKNIQRKPPTEFLNLPSQVSSVQERLKTLDSLPSLLHKILNVPSACQAAASPAEGEKNTKDAGTNLKDELTDLLGKDVVTHYYTKKLLFDKYCDMMLKRKKNPKITKSEVLTKKRPITLKIYREDGPHEVI
nr:hypothetical protein [Tanacetum cinerariifolium]GEW54600.1 hypothetical protein [Tanacetum cinerariifolium]